MYSEVVKRMLETAGIFPGDRLRLTSGKRKFEGILMPRPDSGDPNVLIIKLDNGYNIGLKLSLDSKLEKIEDKEGHSKTIKNENVSQPAKKFNPNLNKVDLIYTGGTIGSKVDYATGGVYMLTKPEELLDSVPEIAGIANLRLNNLMSIASEDMSYMEWQKIAKAVADSLNDGAKGVVITHGTDTMHYTSAALSFMLKDLRGPVVIVGSQRSSDRGSSDAFMNIVAGTRVAAESDIAEVSICMHATTSDRYCNVIRGTKVRKMHTSRRDAFQPINSRPIASVSYEGKITYMGDYSKVVGNDEKTKLMTGFEPKVALIKVHPNSDPGILEYYSGKGYKGVIIEGTGLGHAPVSTPYPGFNWLGHIESAVDSGMIVGMTSQCINGRVNDKVYRNLRLIKKAGGLFCEDMIPEVAYVKLGWLLGNYKRDEAESLLAQNIAGEISRKSEADWFGE